MPIRKIASRQLYLICLMAIVSLGAGPAIAGPKVEISPDMDSLTPQIGAAPANITVEIAGKPVSGSIQLVNLSKNPVSIHTTISNWDLDEENNVRAIAPTSQSLDLWTIVSPVDFTIPPGKTQTVRFSIRPRAKPEPGEHRMIFFFSQAPKELIKSMGVKVLYRLGVPVYGLSGNVVREGMLNQISFSEAKQTLMAQFDITSSGNAGVRMDGQYTIWKKEDYDKAAPPERYILQGKKRNVPDSVIQSGMIPNTPVFSGTRRIVRFAIDKPAEPGEYVINAQGKLCDRDFMKTYSFEVPPVNED